MNRPIHDPETTNHQYGHPGLRSGASTIKLMRPMVRAQVMDAEEVSSLKLDVSSSQPTLPTSEEVSGLKSEIPSGQSALHTSHFPLHTSQGELARLLTTVQRLADSLGRVYEQTMACHRGEIARLAVEIARKILMYKVGNGDYAIQAIVEEALKQAPTRQKVVVHLHPGDLAECQRLQQEDPQSPFAQLEFTADGDLGRGECLVQTPKGVVTSLFEEHLERIHEALQKCDV